MQHILRDSSDLLRARAERIKPHSSSSESKKLSWNSGLLRINWKKDFLQKKGSAAHDMTSGQSSLYLQAPHLIHKTSINKGNIISTIRCCVRCMQCQANQGRSMFLLDLEMVDRKRAVNYLFKQAVWAESDQTQR